LIFLWHL